MLKYLFILLIASSNQLYAQKQRVDVALESYKHTIAYADHKVVFQADQTSEPLKHVAPDKKYFWFSNNQINITQGGYSGKLLHGSYTDFYLNKNLKEQGNFKMGLKEGNWKNWNDQGILISQTTFKEGITEGEYNLYDTTGKLLATGKNKNGKLDGEQKRFFGGDSILVEKYKNGAILPKGRNWIKHLFVKSQGTNPQK